MVRNLLSLAAFGLVLGVGSSAAHAATFIVTTPDDSGPGSLRQAVTDANAAPGADNINFDLPKGVKVINLTTGARAALELTGDVTITGPGADKLTVQRSAAEGTPNFSIFRVVQGVNARIRDLVIANGRNLIIPSDEGPTFYPGGGIVNEGLLNLTDCVLTDNVASGGVRYVGGTGGAVYSIGQLIVDRCTFIANSARSGGAIFGFATVSNSTFWGNSVSGDGFNRSGQGGAIYAFGARLDNCTFSDNSATFAGNALFSDGGSVALNTIFNETGAVAKSNDGNFADGGYNLVRDDGAGLFMASTSKLNANPLLGTLGNYGGSTPTLPLKADSAAIDAGDTSFGKDQRGFVRPVGSADDIGAFERQLRAPIITSLTIEPNEPKKGDTLSAVVGVREFNGDPVNLTYTWARTRKGATTVLRETGPFLPTALEAIAVGDVITVTVVANNGSLDSEPKSNRVSIRFNPASNSPISISELILQPKTPYTFEKMVARVKTVDADKTAPLYSYVWTKNGVVVQTVNNSRSSQNVYDLALQGQGNKNDVIEVTVTASDGLSTDTAKASAKVRNSVPTLANLTLSAASVGGTITSSSTANDADGDTIGYINRWKIGKTVLVNQNGRTLDLSKYPSVKAGDVITLEQRVSDGESLSRKLVVMVVVQIAVVASPVVANSNNES